MPRSSPINSKGTLRIIAGKWRGRKINFIADTNLRPTKDIIKTTLFNWLSQSVHNSKCLDCFAGSGALGFEALSRGAASVVMIDKSRDVVNQLKENAKLLGSFDNVTFYCREFPFITNPLLQDAFDIVFLDPPYNKNLIEPSCLWLQKNHLVTVGTLVYIETEITLSPIPIPTNWEILKSKKSGQVSYYLVIVN